MNKNILLAATLVLFGASTFAVAQAEDINVDQQLSETTARIDAQRQAGKISLKQATDLHSTAKLLKDKIAEKKSKNMGLLSEHDKVKYANKVKALDVKISRVTNPERISDEKSLASIRKAIMNQKGLSSEAQNVKLSFEDGVLVIDGSVKTEKEKEDLINAARSAGAAQVSSKLTVMQ